MSQHRNHDLCLRPKDPYDWRWKFLQHVANGASISVAAAACGKSRQTAHSHLKKFPNFRRKFNHAVMSHVELAETRFKQIAMDPSHLYNYPALVAYLKAYKPDRYNPRPKVESEGLPPEQVAMVLGKILKDPEQLDAAYEEIKSLIDEQRKKER